MAFTRTISKHGKVRIQIHLSKDYYLPSCSNIVSSPQLYHSLPFPFNIKHGLCWCHSLYLLLSDDNYNYFVLQELPSKTPASILDPNTIHFYKENRLLFKNKNQMNIVCISLYKIALLLLISWHGKSYITWPQIVFYYSPPSQCISLIFFLLTQIYAFYWF